MAKQFKCSYRCNEKEIAKLYFEFFNEESTQTLRKKIYYQVFTKDYNQVVIEWVNKYLLHVVKLPPLITQEIIRKYIILFIYSWLKDVNGYNNIIEEFDYLLSKPLSYREMLNTNVSSNLTPLALIFNDKNNFYSDKEKNQKALKKEVSKIKNNETAIKLLKKVHDEFFNDYGRKEMVDMEKYNIKQIDQIIAEGLLESRFYDFNIVINESNFEKYQANIINEGSPTMIKEKIPLIFGILVDNIIQNKNFNLEENIDVNIFKSFQFITFDKNCSAFAKKRCKIKFINMDGSFSKNEIIPFEFMFNNEEYTFTSSGLRKVI